LAEVETRIEKWAAGATKPTIAEMNEKILEFSFWMLKEGYREATIINRTKVMKTLVKRGANIFDPESVKEVIATQSSWSQNGKIMIVGAYKGFARMMKLPFVPPRYKLIQKLPFIPTEREIDQLIAGCGKRVGTYLQLLKETAMRAGEAWNLLWSDVDTVNNTIKVTPEKNGNPRMFKVSSKLIAMLNSLPKKLERVFGGTQLRFHRQNFMGQRKRIANKLQNPRIRKISFKTLRHWKATMEYHRTKDLLYVKQFLGHKSIMSTLVYTHLITFEGDEFTCKVAKTLKEASALIEADFDYVTDIEDAKLFKKRK